MKKNDIKKRSGRKLPPLEITFIDPEIKTEKDKEDYKERVFSVFELLFEEVMKARKAEKTRKSL